MTMPVIDRTKEADTSAGATVLADGQASDAIIVLTTFCVGNDVRKGIP